MKQFYFLVVILSFVSANSQNLGLDSTFGNNGKLVNTSSTSTPRNVYFENNKYFLVNANNSIISLNYDGSPNTSFGINGQVYFNNTNETFTIKGSKLLNGFFYIFGEISYTLGNNKDLFLLKVSMTGFLDSSFGVNGILRQDFGSDEVINDIFITDQGKIVGIGSKTIFGTATMMIRCNINGTIDTTFDNIGYKILAVNPNESFSNGVKLFAFENNILVVGNSRYSSSIGLHNNMVLMKMDTNANYITTFGSNGIKQIPLSSTSETGNSSVVNAMFVNNNELYFNCYYAYSFLTQAMSLRRYNNNSNVLEYLFSLPLYNNNFFVDNNQKIYSTGTERCSPATLSNCSRDFKISKRNQNGSLDTTFNNIGSFAYNFFPSDLVSDDMSSILYLHDDGKIFMAGSGFNPYSMNGTGLEILRLTNVSLDVNENKIDANIKLSPNPSSNELRILKTNIIIDFIKVFDIYGKEIIYQSGNIEKLDIHKLENGMYVLQVNSEKKVLNLKFIKK